MKKLIALTFAMLFLGTGIASATDFSMSGSFYARGTYVDNWDGTGANEKDYGLYDGELSVDTTWQIDDTSKVFARFEMRDETWGASTNPTEGTAWASGTLDDNLVVEMAYGQHTFGNGTTLRLGLMGAGSWATAFGDTGVEKYRVWTMTPTSIGTIFFTLDKSLTSSEAGNAVTGEDSDMDAYNLLMITKFGDVNVKPGIAFVDIGAADTEAIVLLLGLDGTVGDIGWEAEAIYKNYDTGPSALDYDIYGLYGNVWAQFDALKFGALVAYGSYDEDSDKGFGFGDDFTAGGALLLGDDIFTNGSNLDLNAVTLLAAYISYAASEQLTLGAYVGVANSNVDLAGDDFDGAELWELSVSGSYKITDNVTYSVAAGVAQLDYGTSYTGTEPDKAVEVYHKFAFSF